MIGDPSTTCAWPGGPASTGNSPSWTHSPTNPDAHSGGSSWETNDASGLSRSTWHATRARRSHAGRSAAVTSGGPVSFAIRTDSRVTGYGETGHTAETVTRTRTGSHTRT